MNQIQIICTPCELQEYINEAVQKAFDKLIVNYDKSHLNSAVEKPVTVKELCGFLGVTEATIIRWRKKGKIPFMKIGSRILFQKSAVLKSLEVNIKR